MRQYFQCILIICLLAGSQRAAADTPAESNFTRVPTRNPDRYVAVNWWVKDGLPFDEVRDVIQRKNGFIWVATRNGAARFDGVQFETFNTRNVPQMANSSIRSVFEDSRQRLWIGHDSGDITVESNHAFIQLSLPADWPKVPIVGFVEQNATIWAMNRLGDRLPITDLKSGQKIRKRQHMKSIAVERNRIVAVAKDRIIDFTADDMREGSSVVGKYGQTKAFPGADGSLWVVIGGRLQKWRDGQPEEDLGTVPWKNSQEVILVEMEQGPVCVGTSEEGLFIFDRNGRVEQISRINGLGNNQVLCLYEDREHTIWAGTAAGLTAIRPKRVNVIRAEAWRDWIPHSVAPRHAGGIWVGTDGNGLFCLKNQMIQRVEAPAAAPVVYAILEDSQNDLWLNGRQEFLCRIQPQAPNRSESFQIDDLIASLYQDNNQTLWAGGQRDLWQWNGTTWESALSEHQDVSDIRCLTGDSQETLWVGTASSGLGRLFNGEFLMYGNVDGLPSEYINTLCPDMEENTIWIGTGGGGLALWENETFLTVPDPLNSIGNVISFIIDDDRGRLWMITNQGFFIAEKSELKRAALGEIPFVTPLKLDTTDGLLPLGPGNRSQSGCRTDDGILYFATQNGIIVADPDQVQRRDEMLFPIIKTVRADDRKIHRLADTDFTFSPGTDQLDISYTALSFISPHRIQFMYRLAGYNNDWVHGDGSRIARFRHIPAGTYRFEVKACNSDGVWNPVATPFDFEIQPFFWETWWFKTLPFLLAGLVAAALSLTLAERINRQKLIRVERLRAVEQERTRIAMDIHDEIGAGLTQISLLSHLLDRNGQQQSTSHTSELKRVSTSLVRSLDEIVWVITPKNDTLDSLAAYLAKYVSGYLRETGIRCDLDIPIELPSIQIAGPVRHNLFLVVKESLNNVVKHSEATEVTFSMECQHSIFSILIRDNGKGIDSTDPKRFHRGLTSMPERMRQIGGRFSITSNESGGTTIRLELPL